MKRWLSLAMCLPVALSAVLCFGGCTVEKPTSEGGDTTKVGKDLTVVSFTDLYMDKEGTDFNDAKRPMKASTAARFLLSGIRPICSSTR